MDITNIPQALIKGLEQKNTEQLVVLSRVLNLVLGKTVIATISSTEPVTVPERAELLKQTAAALVQIKQQATNQLTPSLKTEIARLMQQQNLIQSPELKWINLVVNNRPLLTYSDRPLVAGQSVPVQLQSPQKLVLLDLPNIEQPVLTKVIPSSTPQTALAPTTNTSADATKNAAIVNALLKAAITELANKTLTTSTAELTNKPIPTSPTNPSSFAKDILTSTVDTTKNTAALNELLKATTTEQPNKTASIPTATPTNVIKNILAATGTNHTPLSSNIDAQDNHDVNSVLPKNIASPTPNTAQDTNSKAALLSKTINYSTNELSLKYATHSANKNTNPETLVAKNIVSENLRNLLPHRDAPNLLLSAINQLQQLPATSRQQLLSPSIEQALKSIAEKIRSPEQLAQPKVLAQTLKNSGVFFENKLNESLQKNGEDKTGSTKTALNTHYTQDLKGSLLTLLSRTTQELNGDKKPLSTEQTIKLLQSLSSSALFHPIGAVSTNPLSAKIDIAQTLGMFVQQLMNKPVKELSDKELRTQLLVLLQQHSVHSLAKIQLQQLHSINHELETKDSATPNASWQIEVPVKQHNDVHHLHMRIDREWVDEKNESETNKSTNKIKQWSVTLRFDLPTLGEFCAQLAIVNTQVSATLWAAREKTFSEVRDHIEGLHKQLESEGIEVKYLQCMRGMPPEKPIALSYSLIDIST
jgi:Flagellar hook-length control protein FliK